MARHDRGAGGAGLIAHIACVAGLAGAFLVGGAWVSGLDPSLVGAYLPRDPYVAAEEGDAADAEGQACVIFLNARLHPDAGERAAWAAFLAGDDGAVVPGTATCVTLMGDDEAMNLALRLARGLAPGQLTVRAEDAILAVSKAEHGTFDVLAISDWVADALDVSALEADPSVEVVRR